MKILFLNRHLQNSTLIPELQRLGVACLVCSDPNEADFVLRIHGKTVSLVVGHDTEGVEFVSKVKNDSKTSSVATLITTSEWTEAQCGQHQKTADGANAYLKTPFEDRVFFKTLDLIFGTELSHGKALHRASPEDLSRLQDYAETQMVQRPSTSDSLSIEKGNTTGTSSGEGISLDFSMESGAGMAIESSSGQQIEATVLSTSLPSAAPVVAEAVTVGDAPMVDPGEFVLNLTPPPDSLVAESLAPEPALSPDASQSSLKIDMAPSEVVAVSASTSEAQPEEDIEDEAAVPGYLAPNRRLSDVLSYPQPVGDAVIPGGASQSPDEETVKKYLLLREQDVATLSTQLKQSKNRIAELEKELQEFRSINVELMHLSQEQEKRIKSFDLEKQVYEQSSQKEIDDLKFEVKKRGDKTKLLELEVRKMAEETEKLKDRVKLDIRKIRTREKELENRLEILKKDSEMLIAGREQKIVDLKRKLDTAEFNLDLLQDKHDQEKQNSAQLREKLDRAAQAVRVAGGLLHPMDSKLEEIPEEPSDSATVKHAV
jgi:hypothetical protein